MGDDAHVLHHAVQRDVLVGLMGQFFLAGEHAAEGHALVQTLGTPGSDPSPRDKRPAGTGSA